MPGIVRGRQALSLLVIMGGLLLARQGEAAGAFSKFLGQMKSSSTGVVEMTDSTFRSMVMDRSEKRDFSTIVLFTAEGSKYGCMQCMYTANIFSQVASSYLLQRYPHERHPLIFAKANVEKNQQTFQMMGLETVPHIYLFKNNTKVTLPPSEDLEVSWHSSDPQVMCDVIHDKVGITITIVPDAATTVWVGVALAALLAILGHLVISHWDSFKLIPWSRKLWIMVSLTVYGGGIGGMVYCVIRSSPLYSYNRDGTISLFLERGQDQIVSEGLIVAGVHLLFAASMVLCYYSASRRCFFPLQYIGVTLSLALACFFLEQIFNMYTIKTRWYSPNGTMPQYVQDAIFGPVRKSSGLLKRLERVSYIFLFEWKSWPIFRKKSEQILKGYLRRMVGLPEK